MHDKANLGHRSISQAVNGPLLLQHMNSKRRLNGTGGDRMQTEMTRVLRHSALRILCFPVYPRKWSQIRHGLGWRYTLFTSRLVPRAVVVEGRPRRPRPATVQNGLVVQLRGPQNPPSGALGRRGATSNLGPASCLGVVA